jgi:sulfate transport system ATP-binding protein
MNLEIAGITKSLGGRRVLDDVRIDVADGELVALLGPSGSGKTTLLRILAGLEWPDAGRVRQGVRDVTDLPPQARRVGLVFQQYALFPHMSVFENVAFALRVRRAPRREIEARVGELLELVRLTGYGPRAPSQLSGGERQRVALARALAVRPDLLLLDEPFGALDAKVRHDLRAWLRRLHDEIGMTTIFVTHDQDEAFEVAHRVAVLNAGRLEQTGTPAEVRSSPATRFVEEFLTASRLPEVA